MLEWNSLWFADRTRRLIERRPKMNISRAAMLQSAADDIGIIADTVEELVRLLDKVFNQYGDEITSRLEQVWPSHTQLGPYVVKELHRLADRLAPPEA